MSIQKHIDKHLCEEYHTHRCLSMWGDLMVNEYTENAQVFKALSDANRLMIIDMLSCGELCACVILEKFNITQPTLSHHMKILCECGLVNGRKVGKWIFYSLDFETIKCFKNFLDEVTKTKENCICHSIECEEVC